MFNMIKSIYKVCGEKRLTTVAGAWVYYFIMSVIPLAFLLATAFGLFGINVLYDLVSTLPEEFRPAGQVIAETAEKVSNGATILFIFTAVFSCTTLLNQMSKDGDFIYDVQKGNKRGIMRRIWAVVALGALFGVFLFMAFVFAFRSRIVPFFITNNALKLILTVMVFSLIIFFCYAIIIVLYKYICPVRQSVKELFIGGFCSLSVIVLGTLALALYLRYFNSYNALYGSFAAIIVFLLWAYIVMLGLATGVIVNKCAYERYNLTSKSKGESYAKNKQSSKILSKGRKSSKRANA